MICCGLCDLLGFVALAAAKRKKLSDEFRIFALVPLLECMTKVFFCIGSIIGMYGKCLFLHWFHYWNVWQMSFFALVPLLE